MSAFKKLFETDLRPSTFSIINFWILYSYIRKLKPPALVTLTCTQLIVFCKSSLESIWIFNSFSAEMKWIIPLSLTLILPCISKMWFQDNSWPSRYTQTRFLWANIQDTLENNFLLKKLLCFTKKRIGDEPRPFFGGRASRRRKMGLARPTLLLRKTQKKLKWKSLFPMYSENFSSQN